MSRTKALKRRLAFLALRLLQGLLWLLPLNAALWLGRWFGRAAGRLATKERARAKRQMIEALEVSEVDSEVLCRRMFEHLGMLIVEMLLIGRIRNRLDDYVELTPESQQALQIATRDGRGAVGVTAHLGNWELFALRIASAGFDLAALARANPNPYLGAWIERMRTEGGVQSIDRDRAVRQMLGALKRGAILAALIDQDTRVPSVFVPFFHRVASTPSSPARLAIRRGLPVLLGFAVRTDTGHRVDLRILDTEGLQGSSEEERVRALTGRMSEAIERAVADHPEQWVWFHERWKTRP